MQTIHMSTTNTTTRARISCDTRWQPQNKPIDHRYVSGIRKDESKFGLQFLSTEQTPEIKRGFSFKILGTQVLIMNVLI